MKKESLVLSIVMSFLFCGVVLAEVGLRNSGGPIGAATDIYFNSGFADGSFDGSIYTVNASKAGITSGTIAGATINSSTLGVTTPAAAKVTTLAVTTSGTAEGVVLGTTTPAAANFTTIGATTAGTGVFSTLQVNTSGTMQGVVIGTTTPAAATFTTVNASSTITDTALYARDASSYPTEIVQVGADGSIYGKGSIAYLPGNLGINTTAPQQKLEVDGIVYLGAGAGATSNYVGIGSVNPQAKLDVEGTVYFNTLVGNVNIGTNNPNYKVAIDGSTYFGNNAVVGAIVTLCRGASGQLGHVTGGTVTAPTCTTP